jgi:hypothetical protein
MIDYKMQVIRAYSLSYGNDPDRHVSYSATELQLNFNETWFQALDMVVEAASYLGIRIIVPFINMVEIEKWGGASTLSSWADVPATVFFEHNTTRKLYKDIVRHVITRNNSITGESLLPNPVTSPPTPQIRTLQSDECCCLRRAIQPRPSDPRLGAGQRALLPSVQRPYGAHLLRRARSGFGIH